MTERSDGCHPAPEAPGKSERGGRLRGEEHEVPG